MYCKMGLNFRKDDIRVFPGKLSIDKDSVPIEELM